MMPTYLGYSSGVRNSVDTDDARGVQGDFQPLRHDRNASSRRQLHAHRVDCHRASPQVKPGASRGGPDSVDGRHWTLCRTSALTPRRSSTKDSRIDLWNGSFDGYK